MSLRKGQRGMTVFAMLVLAAVIGLILIVVGLRLLVLEFFHIPSGAMMPTLLVGDFVVVNKSAYGVRLPVTDKEIIELGEPQRGDIIVFRYPVDGSTPFIKRVVGLPGDHIRYESKVLYINGKPVPARRDGTYLGVGAGSVMTGAAMFREQLGSNEHQVLIRRGFPLGLPRGEGVWEKVPEGHYFVLGDNRDNSQDSRFWGFVPDENLIGKAFLIWMNWDSAADGIIDWSRVGKSID